MNRFLKTLFAICTITLTFASLSAPALAAPDRGDRNDKHEDFFVSVGETRTLSAPGVDRFSNAAPELADIRPDPQNGSNFLITGRKQGTTTLLLIKRDGSQTTYEVVVSSRSAAAVERELNALLEGMPGLRLRRIGPRIFIEGGVSTEADLKKINQIVAVYQGQVESLVVIGGGAAERKLLLRLDVFFVRYEKTSSFAVGLAFPAQIGGAQQNGQPVAQTNIQFDLIGRTTTSATASIINQPLPRLDIASRNGWAKVIKQATVITGNGSEAKLASGGEQNFLQSVGLSTSLIPIEFGTKFTVLPRYDSITKDMEVKLNAEVAELTPPATGTVPGRNTTKLETLVSLKLGQGLVLSGFKFQLVRRDTEGLPLLSDIPILGALFGSQRKSTEDTEGAVLIIPSVVESVPKASMEMIRNAIEMYDDFSGNMKELKTFDRTPPGLGK